jgi:Amt family ammonium transporter
MRFSVVLLALLILAVPISAGAAEEATASPLEIAKEELQTNINIVWTCIAAFLVFFMQAGFAMVETGFTRAKNAVNILMKNLMDFSIGSLVFFLVGFGLMFGKTNGLFGTTLFGLAGVEKGTGWTDLPDLPDGVLPPRRTRSSPVQWPSERSSLRT